MKFDPSAPLAPVARISLILLVLGVLDVLVIFSQAVTFAPRVALIGAGSVLFALGGIGYLMFVNRGYHMMLDRLIVKVRDTYDIEIDRTRAKMLLADVSVARTGDAPVLINGKRESAFLMREGEMWRLCKTCPIDGVIEYGHAIA